jgi:NAD(P)-dependent dehydrogenase (short-subunit alcohol dehydrogenase family)
VSTKKKTMIVTGASKGIGSAIATLFLNRGYSVVGTCRQVSKKNDLKKSEHLALVDGDIGQAAAAQHVVETAIERFGSVDAPVNNAAILFPKAFPDASRQMVVRGAGGGCPLMPRTRDESNNTRKGRVIRWLCHRPRRPSHRPSW